MTVWHDQPSPLSRRQARELARGELARGEIVDRETAEREIAELGDNPSGNAVDAPANGQPTPPPTRRDASSSGGRRVQWNPAAADPEPLTYATQGKIPSTDPVVESRPIAPTEQQTPTGEPVEAADEAQEERPAFRLRDYRPDGRRSTFGSLGSRAQTGHWTPPPTDDLEYRTHGGPGSDSSLLPLTPDPRPAAPTSGPPATNEPTPTNEPTRSNEQAGPSSDYSTPSDLVAPEHTMTRRELRALRERAEAASQVAAQAAAEAAGEPAAASEPAASEAATSEPAASVEPVADAAGVVEELPAEPVAPIPDASSQDVSRPVIPQLVEPLSPEADSARPSPSPQAAEPEVIEAELIVEEPAPRSESLTPFEALFRPPSERAAPAAEPNTVTEDLVPDPSAAAAQPVAARQVDTPDQEETGKPYGHWSTQAAIDDASQLNEATLRRDVGATTGAITTHALVLPSIPETGDQLLSPLTSTGEIMVTGSFDLPRSFGSTGAHPALFDHSDVDALIDESDREDAPSESAPVRAIRAVSSNTSTRGVIEAPAPQKSRLPLILGIVFGGVLLVAVGVVIAGLIFNAF